jgi:hypothetical protein
MRAALALVAMLAVPAVFAAGEATPVDEAAEEDAWDEEWSDPWAVEEDRGLSWTGFVEAGGGWRWNSVDNLDAMTLGDLRLRAETRYDREGFRLDFKGDLNWDQVVEELDAKVRELVASFRMGQATDVKAGRQILTWGTGDLLFLNDLFPKDFVSFFAGRDDEYLKAPSDTLRVSHYADLVNAEIAWTPRFTADDYLYGERFAFYDPGTGSPGAPEDPHRVAEPNSPEVALRLFRTFGRAEAAAYGYVGRWKQPIGARPSGEPWFPRLNAWGASLRTGLGPGIFNTEFSWYDSRDDRDGDDPLVPNSQLRFLAGYEQEVVANLTGAGQFYVERILDHDAQVDASPDPATEPEKWRTLVTGRLTHRAFRETLISSLFVFWSPNQGDFYLRPNVTWRRDDHWTLAGGFNVFGGDEDTFFGQLEDNSNGWVRLRYNY